MAFRFCFFRFLFFLVPALFPCLLDHTPAAGTRLRVAACLCVRPSGIRKGPGWSQQRPRGVEGKERGPENNRRGAKKDKLGEESAREEPAAAAGPAPLPPPPPWSASFPR